MANAKPVNLSEVIRTIRGAPAPVAAPTHEEASLAGEDPTKLPRETVGTLILNALSMYQVDDRKETFLVQMAAEATLDGMNPKADELQRPIEYKDKVRALIVKALHQCTRRSVPPANPDGQPGHAGFYAAFAVAQALRALGEEAPDSE